jgi:hypothetical protein
VIGMTLIRTLVALMICVSFSEIGYGQSQPLTSVRIRLASSASGVSADYSLDRPVSKFAFEYNAAEPLKDEWTIATPGLIFENNEVRRSDGLTFSSFKLEAKALIRRRTISAYPRVFPIGDEGRAVYASYFVGRQEEFASTLEFELRKGEVVLGLPAARRLYKVDRAYFSRQAASRYIYIGPSQYVHPGKFADYIADPDLPVWIRREIRQVSTRAISYFAAKLHQPLPGKALFLISHDLTPASKFWIQGDVTDGSVAGFQIVGARWKSKTTVTQQDITEIVAHEVAHFWNGSSFRSLETSAPWLHEGSANYFSYLFANSNMQTGADTPVNAVNICIRGLGSNSVNSTQNYPAYECGEAVQWFTDLGQRKSGRDIFALWRSLFAIAKANGGFYSSTMFRKLAEQDTSVSELLKLVFEPGPVERWNQLPEKLAPFGVNVQRQSPSPEEWRGAAVAHVLAGQCDGGYGFWTNEKSLKLDTGERCGPLSGDPEVDAVNGHDLLNDAKGVYDAIEVACKTGEPISFSRRNVDQKWIARCTKPLAPPPPRFSIIGSSLPRSSVSKH